MSLNHADRAPRVLLDARPTMGGVHRSTMELARHLGRSLPADALLAYGRRCAESEPPPERSVARRWAGRLLGWLRRLAVEQAALPLAARGADLFHATDGRLPLVLPVPAVVTVHDLTLWRHPETKKPGPMTRYERWGAERGLRLARRIVTPSDAVAADVARTGHVSPERVTRIYPFLPPLDRIDPASETSAHAFSANAHEDFLLSVGTVEPRKNLGRLLDAHRRAWPELRLPLLLVGAYGWGQRSLLRRVGAEPKRVRWLGRVDDVTLAGLYRRARAVVQVSVEEGFDYPVAEAMSLGAPVVLSDLAVHREVAGDAGVYAPAEDPEAIGSRLVEVVRWSEEGRARYRHAAAQRVARLHRSTSVDQYLAVYRAALEEARADRSAR